jgi:hypothetical protein
VAYERRRSHDEVRVTITFTIGTATLVAAGVAILHVLQPESWAPFYRVELAKKTTRTQTIVGMLIGLVGQAATTAAVALFVTILIMSVVAAADARTHLWAGVAVLALSTTFFVRSWTHRAPSAVNAGDLIAEFLPGSAAARNPHEKSDESLARVTRSAIFSARLILAPMFLAATGSGRPGVGNALPVVVAYALCSAVGVAWIARRGGGGAAANVLRFLVRRANLLTGIAVAVLGLVTALVG